jgi:hypothetical protein
VCVGTACSVGGRVANPQPSAARKRSTPPPSTPTQLTRRKRTSLFAFRPLHYAIINSTAISLCVCVYCFTLIRISPDWRERVFIVSLCQHETLRPVVPRGCKLQIIEFGSEQPLANQTPLGRRERPEYLTLIIQLGVPLN